MLKGHAETSDLSPQRMSVKRLGDYSIHIDPLNVNLKKSLASSVSRTVVLNLYETAAE
jgi:hypothetical protein